MIELTTRRACCEESQTKEFGWKREENEEANLEPKVTDKEVQKSGSLKVKLKFDRVKTSSFSAASNMVHAKLPCNFRVSAIRIASPEDNGIKVKKKAKVEFQFADEDNFKFEKLPDHKTKHLKALMMMGRVDGCPVN